MIQSLHARLITLIGISVMILFVICGCAVCWLIEASLWAEFDRGLRDHVESLSQLLERDQKKLVFEWQEAGGVTPPIDDNGEVLEIWDAGQRILPLDDLPARLDIPPGTYAGIFTVQLARNRPGRAVILTFKPRIEREAVDICAGHEKPSGDVRMVFARPTARLDATINRVRGVLTAVGIGGVLATLAIVWFAVDLGLKPIDRTAAEIAALGSESIDRRIGDENDQPWELRSLTQTINRLLARLQATLEHERAFSADVAHELRTPIAGLRAKLDVALARSRSVSEHEQTLHECMAITLQTSAIIESLLATTKLTQRDSAKVWVDLQRVILDMLQSSDDVINERQLTASTDLPNDLMILGQPTAIKMLLRNLIDNALAYADVGSAINISAHESPNSWQVRISNAAQGFPASEIERVFERFWRADTSRTATGHHSGLGLPLCKRLAESVGGQIYASYLDQRFIVEIEFGKHDN